MAFEGLHQGTWLLLRERQPTSFWQTPSFFVGMPCQPCFPPNSCKMKEMAAKPPDAVHPASHPASPHQQPPPAYLSFACSSAPVPVPQLEQVQALLDVLDLYLLHATDEHASLIFADLQVLALRPQQVLQK